MQVTIHSKSIYAGMSILLHLQTTQSQESKVNMIECNMSLLQAGMPYIALQRQLGHNSCLPSKGLGSQLTQEAK